MYLNQHVWAEARAAALAEPSVATVAAYERGRQDALAEREEQDARLRAAGDALATLVISHITPGDCFQRDERLVEWWAAIAKTPEAEPRTCADYVALVGRLRAVIADHEDAPGSRIARYGGDALLRDLVDVLAKTPEETR